ncbi:MAG: DUF885 family protein, partial [Acidimicrobiales bacterium]
MPDDHAALGPVAAVAERYVEQLATLHPILATHLGVPGHEHEIDDLSPAGVAASETLLRETLADLAAAEPGDDRERTAAALMQERLALELERHEVGLPYGDLNVLASAPQDLRQIFDLMPTGTAEERAAVRDRLVALPAALAGLAETYREGVRRGVVPARRQVAEVAAQCRRWAGLEGAPGFFSTFAASLGDGDDLDGPAA